MLGSLIQHVYLFQIILIFYDIYEKAKCLSPPVIWKCQIPDFYHLLWIHDEIPCGSVKSLWKWYTHEWALFYSQYGDFCVMMGLKCSVSGGMILQEWVTCGCFYISFCTVKAEQILKCNSLNLPSSADWTALSSWPIQSHRYDAPKPVILALFNVSAQLISG